MESLVREKDRGGLCSVRIMRGMWCETVCPVIGTHMPFQPLQSPCNQEEEEQTSPRSSQDTLNHNIQHFHTTPLVNNLATSLPLDHTSMNTSTHPAIPIPHALHRPSGIPKTSTNSSTAIHPGPQKSNPATTLPVQILSNNPLVHRAMIA